MGGGSYGGSIRKGKDSQERKILHRNREALPQGPRVHPATPDGGPLMALSPYPLIHRQELLKIPCKGAGHRVPLNEEGATPTPLQQGIQGLRAPPHQPPPDNRLPPPLPQFRNAFRGKHAESEEGTAGSSGQQRRHNEHCLKFLLEPHALDPPSTEDLQRVFPRLVEFQRIMFPLKIKKVDHCDWKAILELPTSLETGEQAEAY